MGQPWQSGGGGGARWDAASRPGVKLSVACACPHISSLLKTYGQHPRLVTLRGQCLLYTGDVSSAQKHFQKSARMQPTARARSTGRGRQRGTVRARVLVSTRKVLICGVTCAVCCAVALARAVPHARLALSLWLWLSRSAGRWATTPTTARHRSCSRASTRWSAQRRRPTPTSRTCASRPVAPSQH